MVGAVKRDEALGMVGGGVDTQSLLKADNRVAGRMEPQQGGRHSRNIGRLVGCLEIGDEVGTYLKAPSVDDRRWPGFRVALLSPRSSRCCGLASAGMVAIARI